LLVGLGFVIADSLIGNKLPPELALLVRHLRAEIDLLSCMLLFKLLSEGRLFSLVGILDLETTITKNVLLVETKFLHCVQVGILRHLVLKLFKLILINFEVLLNGTGFLNVLICVLLNEKFEELLFLSELFHEKSRHAF
jgi:hypothetical protein